MTVKATKTSKAKASKVPTSANKAKAGVVKAATTTKAATAVKVDAPKVDLKVADVDVETKNKNKNETETKNNSDAASPESAVTKSVEALYGEIAKLTGQLSILKKSLSSIQKEYNKEKKQWARIQNKKKSSSSSGVKHQSGIAKPGFISPELCNFLGVNEGTEMARTEVIKYVNHYIKEHKLQDSTNKKKILPDAALQTLLQSKDSDEITYFNLQTFMKPHYAKPTVMSALS